MSVKFLFCSYIYLLVILSSAYGQDTLTVMSYNIYHAKNPETAESTVQDIANFIGKVQPDFVALQEVDNRTRRLARINDDRFFSLTDSLAQLTGMVGYFEESINFDGGEYGIAILSRDKFAFHNIDLPNPKQGEPRIMIYLEAETSAGFEFIFANTHLDNLHWRNRLAQAEKLNMYLKKNGKPVILAGDLNFTPDSRQYKSIQSQWIDAADNLRERATYPTANPTKRIDYILLSKQSDWKIIDFQTYNVPYSDHLPVVAKVVIEER